MEVVFVRCFVSMLLCFTIVFRDKLDWKGSNRKLLLARGMFGTTALYTFFITLREMPLGTAVTIQYLSPVFTTIIAIFLLKEKVKSSSPSPSSALSSSRASTIASLPAYSS